MASTDVTFLAFRKVAHKLSKNIMESHRLRIPRYEMPIRLRPWFLGFTCIVMAVLAFLGFTNFSQSLPLNDKLLHFICFFLATGVFYFIIDVEENARRIWFWRHSGLIFTAFVCFLCGGVLSEVVQSFLPYKQFELGDVVANLLGSSLGLFTAHRLERYYRHRREIARLYRPINTSLSDLEDDIDGHIAPLLPLHTNTPVAIPRGVKSSRFADVWDEREEPFYIVGASDEEDDIIGEASMGVRTPLTNGGLTPK